MAARPFTPEQVAALLDAARVEIEAELRALGDVEAGWHPEPGEWCVKEVLGHLIEAERRGFAGRIRAILDESHPALASWDPPAVAAARGDCERTAGSLRTEFTRLRRDSVALVRSLRPSELRRAGLHPHVGELRVADLLQEWVHHDRNHVKQILSNVQARAWPHMGNARGFSARDG